MSQGWTSVGPPISCWVCKPISLLEKKSEPGPFVMAGKHRKRLVHHTDFERGFIKAEVYSIDDLVNVGAKETS